MSAEDIKTGGPVHHERRVSVAHAVEAVNVIQNPLQVSLSSLIPACLILTPGRVEGNGD